MFAVAARYWILRHRAMVNQVCLDQMEGLRRPMRLEFLALKGLNYPSRITMAWEVWQGVYSAPCLWVLRVIRQGVRSHNFQEIWGSVNREGQTTFSSNIISNTRLPVSSLRALNNLSRNHNQRHSRLSLRNNFGLRQFTMGFRAQGGLGSPGKWIPDGSDQHLRINHSRLKIPLRRHQPLPRLALLKHNKRLHLKHRPQ